MAESVEMAAQTADQKPPEQPKGDWLIKLSRRKDQRKYYLHERGMTTARVDHLMLLPEADAKQLAYALRTQHPDFTATAMKCPKRFLQKPTGKKKEKPKVIHSFTDDPKLRDCPFCGGVAEVGAVKDGQGRRLFAVRCADCYCGTVYLKTRAAATGRWNARTKHKEPTKEAQNA